MKSAKLVSTIAGLAMAGVIGLGHAQMNKNAPENKNQPAPRTTDTIVSSPGGPIGPGGMNKNAPENKKSNKSAQARAEAATDTSTNTPKGTGMNQNAPENKK